MNYLKTILFCIGICFSSNLLATDFSEDDSCWKARPWKLGASAFYGYLINHTKALVPINEQEASAAEVFVSKSLGDKRVSLFYNDPEIGLAFLYMNTGSPSFVGNAQGFYPFVQFSLFDNRNPFNLSLRTGIGLAYMDKIHDPGTNPKNLAIGSHINCLFNMQWKLNYRIDSHWRMNAGISLHHFSNGAYTLPNKGMNIASFTTEINYAFGTTRMGSKEKPDKTLPCEQKRKWQTALFLSGGIKEIYPVGGNKYGIGNASFELSLRHLAYTRFVGTLDVTYDASIEKTKAGIAGGYQLYLGRLSALIQVGSYLNEKNSEYGIIYQRTVLRYDLSKHSAFNFGLRSQKGKAEFVEAGIGMYF